MSQVPNANDFIHPLSGWEERGLARAQKLSCPSAFLPIGYSWVVSSIRNWYIGELDSGSVIVENYKLDP